jgi:stage V sporulation protein B
VSERAGERDNVYAPPQAEVPPVAGGDMAQKAGRGGLAIAAAKIFFIATGLVQQVVLQRILGLAGYGALGRVQGLASMIYNPLNASNVQALSRVVARASAEEKQAAMRRAYLLHDGAGVALAAVFLVAAPFIAELMRAPYLTRALQIMSAVLLFYGLYTPFVGVINGERRFTVQAGLDVLAATLRTAGLLGGAWLLARRDAGVEGALIGFVASTAIVTVVALPLAGLGRAGEGGVTLREHLAFIGPLVGGQLALNALLQSDFQLLGIFAADAAASAGLVAQTADGGAADTLAGAYRAAQLFCFLPYQLLLSVAFVLFPLLATAHRDQDKGAIAEYVRTGIRVAVVVAGAFVAVNAAIPRALLRLVFGPESSELGGEAMAVMAVGMGFFAIFGIFTSVLTSLKRERISALLTVVALAAVVALCFTLVRGQPFGPGLLLRTAIATGSGLALATLLGALAVHRAAGAVVGLATVARVLAATAAAIAVGRVLPAPGKLMTVGYALVIGLVYVAVLVVTRELGKADLSILKRVARR